VKTPDPRLAVTVRTGIGIPSEKCRLSSKHCQADVAHRPIRRHRSLSGIGQVSWRRWAAGLGGRASPAEAALSLHRTACLTNQDGIAPPGPTKRFQRDTLVLVWTIMPPIDASCRTPAPGRWNLESDSAEAARAARQAAELGGHVQCCGDVSADAGGWLRPGREGRHRMIAGADSDGSRRMTVRQCAPPSRVGGRVSHRKTIARAEFRTAIAMALTVKSDSRPRPGLGLL